MRIAVAGASGFMGRFLVDAFRADGDEVVTIGRGPTADAGWDDSDGLRRVVDGADLVVNLAGRSVNCRYGPANRAEILRSRVDTTRALGVAIGGAAAPPPLWINSSTATIYRHAEDRPMTESTGELGTGFSVSVAKAWEEAFLEPELPATRRVALRTAIVLGDGSALLPLARLAGSASGAGSSTAGGSPPDAGGLQGPSIAPGRGGAASGSAGCTSTTSSG
jgi:NAD dependent epimerase/dehydratase family enzyme